MTRKEERFYTTLQDIFVGAKVEGKGGFINLMRIKAQYYSGIEGILRRDIESALRKATSVSFRDELFDKLYGFFNRYFTSSGAIYFNATPFHNNIYEQVYTDDKDVILFWKTQMLYYVKTDRILRSMPLEFDNEKFYFDASELNNKKANEKRSLVFAFDTVRDDDTIVCSVQYATNGTKTDRYEILKAIKQHNISITEETLERVFRIFEKQSEVDFFINKNAKAFLQEQFKLWSYQYVWDGAKEWSAMRVNQLQILKDIAFKIIDFVSQFEDELLKIWNKPKFAKNSNYVITRDRIVDNALYAKITAHKNFPKQVAEWEALGIDADSNHAPIDTKYFKDLELELLAQFDNVDAALDGRLIKSENYQALHTILPKFKEQIQTIYIDPPFNKESDADYLYSVKYKDATWASMLENRLQLAREMLNETGSIFVRCDYNGNWIVRFLMDDIFDSNYKNEIALGKSAKITEEIQRYHSAHDSLLFFTKGENFNFKPATRKRTKPQWMPMHLPGIRWSPIPDKHATLFSKQNIKITNGKLTTRARIILGKELLPPEDRHWALSQEEIFIREKQEKIRWSEEGHPQTQQADEQMLTDNWTDGVGYASTWGFQTENHEKIIERVIHTSSLSGGDFVCDFFLGSGTTTAVAHKLGRKWLGVEMGEHFYEVVLPRMKRVLAYDKTGISKSVTEYHGGGFFKYYELEQYEEALAKCDYKDGDLFNAPGRNPYQQYVFMQDEKMLKALEIDYEKKKVNVDLATLYPHIDIAETLSNLLGKGVKQIRSDEVEFDDGTIVNIKDIDYKLIKPLIWW